MYYIPGPVSVESAGASIWFYWNWSWNHVWGLCPSDWVREWEEESDRLEKSREEQTEGAPPLPSKSLCTVFGGQCVLLCIWSCWWSAPPLNWRFSGQNPFWKIPILSLPATNMVVGTWLIVIVIGDFGETLLLLRELACRGDLAWCGIRVLIGFLLHTDRVGDERSEIKKGVFVW